MFIFLFAMKYEYEPQGTCSKKILLDIDDETKVINDVQFVGGCPGNTIGVSMLVKGQKADDVVKKLEGICCGMKRTSCPDQLAQALRAATLGIALLFAVCLTSCQESKTQRLEREAQELTERTCPQRIMPDGSVILDSIVYHDDGSNEIGYFYQVNTDDEGVVKLQLQKKELERQLLSTVINSIDLRNVKEMGVTIVSHFDRVKADSLGNQRREEILTFRFTKEDYR